MVTMPIHWPDSVLQTVHSLGTWPRILQNLVDQLVWLVLPIGRIEYVYRYARLTHQCSVTLPTNLACIIVITQIQNYTVMCKQIELAYRNVQVLLKQHLVVIAQVCVLTNAQEVLNLVILLMCTEDACKNVQESLEVMLTPYLNNVW